MVKGIITGDIVDSTHIPTEFKEEIQKVLKAVVDDFTPSVSLSYEMYRGDSFQFVVDKAEHALSVAIAIRTALKAHTPKTLEQWDARIAIGIGTVSFNSSSILTSDGEAFQLSGREFDCLGKRRLSIVTPWSDINEELKLSTLFADDIISKWTIKQSEIVYATIFSNMVQKEQAQKFGMSVQNISKHWNLAKGSLINQYINRFTEIINKQK